MHSNNIKVSIHPLNKQLIDAMNLYCLYRNTSPKGFWIDILKFTKYKPNVPNIKGVVFFNKYFKGISLEEILNSIRKDNKIRTFKFDLLRGALENQGEKCNL